MAELFRIEPAGIDDLAGVASLLREAKLPIEGVEERLAAGYVVVREGGGISGVCGVERHGGDGLLRSVAVSPSARNRSLGRAMVEDRIAWARDEGLRRLYLLTTDAERYFERFGFVRIDRADAPDNIRASSEFSTLCPDTAVVMVLSLGDPGEDE